MINQYDLRTGTKFVISGFIQLIPATNSAIADKIPVTAIVIGDLRAKSKPESAAAHPTNIMVSYPLLQGAWSEIYQRMRLATENNLIIHRHHWNIDLAPWGIPAAFIEEVGWSKNIVLSEKCLRIVELQATPLAKVAEHLKSCLKLPFVRVVSPNPGHMVRRIGIAPGGSGQGWGTPAKYESLGCDTIIVGDMIHACAKMAAECGLAVIDGFHHATEEPGLRVLTAKIAMQFPDLPVKFFEEPMPWQAL